MSPILSRKATAASDRRRRLTRDRLESGRKRSAMNDPERKLDVSARVRIVSSKVQLMTPNPDTRKPVDELDLADLIVFPVWEFAVDEEAVEGQDETWVRPVNTLSIPRVDLVLALAVTFTTKSGDVFEGMIWANTVNDLQVKGAAIIAKGRYLSFSVPDGPFRSDRKATATVLGFAEQELYPLSFTLCLPIEGEWKPRTGTFL